MARSEQPDPHRTAPDGDDTISAAARQLAEATAALTRMLGKQVQDVMPEVGEALASSLREASRGLADASENVAKRAGARRADDRRREKVDQTRADLLAAGARAFARQGYEGSSVGDIAADAGYTKGALYAHFGSKNELFLAVAREQIAAAPEQACLPDLDGGDLEGGVTEALRAMQDETEMLLTLEFLSYAVRHPESRGEIGAFYEEGFRELAGQIARARHPEDPAPAQHDWDTALAMVSISNISLLVGTVTGSAHASPEAGARLITRLLRD
ncbi:MAG TPA: helix-turn-helix domain-containing protein [Cellulomonas sp.]